MALTIIERPYGHVVECGVSAQVTSVYGPPDATIHSPSHGLTGGTWIYIESTVESYNGFWVIEYTGTDTFKIKPYETADNQAYIKDVQITYCVSVYDHTWSAVHLPITYTISNDLYPTNGVNPVRTITSITNDNGFSILHLSAIGLGPVRNYDSLHIVIPSADIDGIYKILDFISPIVMVVDLVYDTYTLTSATAQKYYDNYNVLVRVYAGLPTDHQHQTEKPTRLLTTISIVPDENNEVYFSINDIIKGDVQSENNLTIDTLPNNIDAWTGFYIEIAESYDRSDGYALGVYTSVYTSDRQIFQGYAVNAKMQFKNLHSGSMSEYVMAQYLEGKFLTLFDEPVIFDVSYQDVSILKVTNDDLQINFQYYINGASGLLEKFDVTGDRGIYRIPLTANCDYDRVDITIYADYEFVPPPP